MTVSSEIIFDLTPSDDIQVAFTKSCQILLAITNSKRRSTRVCVISGIRTGTETPRIVLDVALHLSLKLRNCDCSIRDLPAVAWCSKTGGTHKLMPGTAGGHKLKEEVSKSLCDFRDSNRDVISFRKLSETLRMSCFIPF
ncbi:hypothetical protein F7725_027130 [Dissostichus mawsoni]|uniref:Uncharacterized protein n=1 Tax=Dissostichus mawsoni TaxID=36200 RepID=A0A7J5XC17_DISMA|nr:hypothetical protein F7725_027130 [Dissostichus mawsoni]